MLIFVAKQFGASIGNERERERVLLSPVLRCRLKKYE